MGSCCPNGKKVEPVYAFDNPEIGLTDCNDATQATQAKLEQAEAEREKLAEENETLQQELKTSEKDREDIRICSLKSLILLTECKDETQGTQAKLEQAEAERDNLLGENEMLRQELKTSTEQNGSLQQKLKTSGEKIEDVREISYTQAKLEQAEAERDSLSEENETLRQELKTSAEQNGSLHQKLNSSEISVLREKSYSAVLREISEMKMTDLKSELESQNYKLQALSSRLVSATERELQMKRSLKDSQEKMAESEKKNFNIERERRRLADDLVALRSKFNSECAKAIEVWKAHEQLKENTKGNKAIIRQQNGEMIDLREQCTAAFANLVHRRCRESGTYMGSLDSDGHQDPSLPPLKFISDP